MLDSCAEEVPGMGGMRVLRFFRTLLPMISSSLQARPFLPFVPLHIFFRISALTVWGSSWCFSSPWRPVVVIKGIWSQCI